MNPHPAGGGNGEVLSEHEIVVCLRGGTEIHQEMV